MLTREAEELEAQDGDSTWRHACSTFVVRSTKPKYFPTFLARDPLK